MLPTSDPTTLALYKTQVNKGNSHTHTLGSCTVIESDIFAPVSRQHGVLHVVEASLLIAQLCLQ